MEQLIELLQQIQDLAGIAIDALNEAASAAGGGETGPPVEGKLPPEGAKGGPPVEGKLPPGGAEGGPPPEEDFPKS